MLCHKKCFGKTQLTDEPKKEAVTIDMQVVGMNSPGLSTMNSSPDNSPDFIRGRKGRLVNKQGFGLNLKKMEEEC